MRSHAGILGALSCLAFIGLLDLRLTDPATLAMLAGVITGTGIAVSCVRSSRETGATMIAIGVGGLLAAGAAFREQSFPDAGLPSSWTAPFGAARDVMEERITRLFPEPHAALLTGLLTGARTSMPKNFTDALRVAGIIHIVAISGYNITLVLNMSNGALRWLPRRLRRPLQILSVAAFTLFVGADAPVVRAAIMGTLGVLAVEGGRIPDVRRAIVWSAVLMLLWTPSQLVESAGFQLSFLSVLGIVELSPLLERLDRWTPDVLGLRESLKTTIAAQCGTLPLIACVFGSIPLLSLPANILVAPLVPLTMLLGALALVADALWPPAGLAVSYAAWASLAGIVWIAEFFGGIPGASLHITLPANVAAAVYAIAGLALYRRHICLTTDTRTPFSSPRPSLS